MEQPKNINKIRWILTGVMALVLAVCVARLFWISREYKESKDLYEQTEQTYVTEPAVVPEDIAPEWYQQISVDLESMQAENPEVSGWIYFENEPSLSYPVMHADNNKKYLRTAWQGGEAVAGSIFTERSNAADFTDPHTIIYGHNMRNESMFGKLKHYKTDADYYPDHQFFQIITNSMYYRYWIVACKDVSDRNGLFTVWMEDGEDFRSFVQEKVLGESLISAGYIPDPGDHIITLSTCNNTQRKRFTVSAVRVAQQPRTAP